MPVNGGHRMRIYLDLSCLGRPFDDQWQTRIRLETEAVAILFDRFESGAWQHVSSQMVRIEIAAMSEMENRRRVLALLPDSTDIIPLSSLIFERAESLEGLGFKPVDAVHVAAGKHSGLTCCSPATTVCFESRVGSVAGSPSRLTIHCHGFENTKMRKTPKQIRVAGLAALKRELGSAGMIRFLQQFERGSGDWSVQRRQWVDRISLGDLRKAARGKNKR